MSRPKKQKFKVLDLVRMKPAMTPYGISDAGIGVVHSVDSSSGNIHVMFPVWEKPRPMHPSVLQEVK
jgi:hypothetical protein